MPKDDFLDALNEPATTTPTGFTVGLSPHQRLDRALRATNASEIQPPPPLTAVGGVPNPYGRGLDAFEPNNVLFDAYSEAKGESDASKVPAPGTGATATTPTIKGDGKVATAIRNAMQLAARRVPYVWGGTTANGVDCSGLLYYAFSSAGLDVKRWRAKDYGSMGTAVTVDQARPGDIVYYDEPGETDHVGIYVGNGQMIQAPQSGDVVRVSSIGKPTSIRRIFEDSSFGAIATPGGGTTWSYGGQVYNPVVGTAQPFGGPVNTAATLGSTITRPRVNPAPAVHGTPF